MIPKKKESQTVIMRQTVLMKMVIILQALLISYKERNNFDSSLRGRSTRRISENSSS